MDHRAQEQWCWEPSLMYEPIRASDMASPLQTLWRWGGERHPARVVVPISDEDRRQCQARPKLASPSLSTVSKKRQAPELASVASRHREPFTTMFQIQRRTHDGRRKIAKKTQGHSLPMSKRNLTSRRSMLCCQADNGNRWNYLLWVSRPSCSPRTYGLYC